MTFGFQIAVEVYNTTLTVSALTTSFPRKSLYCRKLWDIKWAAYFCIRVFDGARPILLRKFHMISECIMIHDLQACQAESVFPFLAVARGSWHLCPRKKPKEKKKNGMVIHLAYEDQHLNRRGDRKWSMCHWYWRGHMQGRRPYPLGRVLATRRGSCLGKAYKRRMWLSVAALKNNDH